MSDASPFEILGIESCRDPRELKKAYLRKIKSHNPESDPEGFQRVRAAYDQALELTRSVSAHGSVESHSAPTHPTLAREDTQDRTSEELHDSEPDQNQLQVQLVFEKIKSLLLSNDLDGLDAFLTEQTEQAHFWAEIEAMDQLNILLIEYLLEQDMAPCPLLVLLHQHLEWRTRITSLAGRMEPETLNAFWQRYGSLHLRNHAAEIDNLLESFKNYRSVGYTLATLKSDINTYLAANPECKYLLEARIYIWLGEVDLNESVLFSVFEAFGLYDVPSEAHAHLISEEQRLKTWRRFNPEEPDEFEDSESVDHGHWKIWLKRLGLILLVLLGFYLLRTFLLDKISNGASMIWERTDSPPGPVNPATPDFDQ